MTTARYFQSGGTLHYAVSLLLLLFLGGCGADAPPPGSGLAPVSCQAADPCPYQTPYCLAGACAPCSADPSLCRGRTPYCLGPEAGEEAGRCGACRTFDDCAGAGLCWHGACLRSCEKNSDCASGACVRSDDGVRGGCAPAEETITVDNATAAFQSALFTVGAAEEARAEALSTRTPTLPPALRVVRLLPAQTTYEPPVITSSVTIVGDDDPATTVLGGRRDRDGVRIEASTPAEIRLQRVRVAYAGRGVFCDASARGGRGVRVSLVDVLVHSIAQTGVHFRGGCDLSMERVAVRNAYGGAVEIQAPGLFSIENSVFSDSSNLSGPLLDFHGVEGTLRYSTVYNNLSGIRRVVACGGGALVTLSQSLILRSQPPDNPKVPEFNDPILGSCTLQDVVLDVVTRNPGGLQGEPRLVDPRPFGDYRPVQAPETLACCLRPEAPGPVYDFAGTPRQYPLATLGAFEVVR